MDIINESVDITNSIRVNVLVLECRYIFEEVDLQNTVVQDRVCWFILRNKST